MIDMLVDMVSGIAIVIIATCTCSLSAVSGNNVIVTPYDLTRLDPIEITALGRVARLGEFYDIRNDQFLHLPIFQREISNASIEATQNRETKLAYTLDNSFAEKFKILEVSAELKLSVLSGLVDLKASGQYFRDRKTSAKSAKASLVQSFSNIYEQISILDSGLKSFINYDLLTQIEATHVVVGIEWGGNVFISVEDLNESNQDVEEVQSNLGVQVQHIAASVSNKASVNISDAEREKLSRFSFEVYGDLVPKTVPETIIDALEFMRTSPDLLLEANNQRGKPIKYVLLPLAGLKRFWNINGETSTLVNRIDETTITNCVNLFDDLNTISQTINDVANDVNKYRKYLALEKVRKINDLKSKFDIYNIQITSNLSEHLVKVRSGQEQPIVLQNILLEAAKQGDFWQKENDDILTLLRREISFLKILQGDNVDIFEKDQQLDHFLWQHYQQDIYVLFFTYADNIMSDKSLHILKTLAEKKKETKSNDLIMAINYDFINDATIAKWNKTNKICIYRNGALVFDDYPNGNKNNGTSNQDGFWSLEQVQKHVEDIEKQMSRIDALEKHLNAVEASQKTIIPVGFIYVQLPNQPEPQALWKETQWENVSPHYSGLFFRSEGAGAGPFGQLQNDFAPTQHIESYFSTHTIGESKDRCYNKECELESKGWSDWIFTGHQSVGNSNYIKFNSTRIDGEVRPKNTAVRIWKRTA